MMLVQAIRLLINVDIKSARGLMFASFIYHPLVMIVLMFDKI
jgi:protoheme IX farnesyltransferase